MYIANPLNHSCCGHGKYNYESAEQDTKKTQSEITHEDRSSRLDSGQLKKVLNDKIVGALEQALSQKDIDQIYQLQAEDVSPNKVASRVLAFISQALQGKEHGSDEFNTTLEQAQEGVKKGFNEAKDILQSLGVFNGDIKNSAEETHQRLQQGLNKFASTNYVETQAFHQRSTSLRQSVDIQVQTKEGDIVTIQVKNAYGSQESLHTKQNDESASMNFQKSSFSKEQLSFSIEGDLDKDELRAIESLVQQINHVSGTFFEGDTQAAFEKVQQIGFNSAEIAGYDFKVKEIQHSKETMAYQEVDKLANTHATRDEASFAPFKNFIADFMNTFTNVSSSPKLPAGEKAFLELFSGLPQMDSSKLHAIEKMEATGNAFNDIAKQLLDFGKALG